MSMIPSDCIQKLKLSLIKHEGYLSHPSIDFQGKIKIGIGYDLNERGISDNWIQNQFMDDVLFFNKSLSEHTKFYNKLNNCRKMVLIEMAFMGFKRFLVEFSDMFDELDRGFYKNAAKRILESSWAASQMDRASKLSESMRTGVYYL
jgi:lysozyme